MLSNAGPNGAHLRVQPPTFAFRDKDITFALKYENTCNPILRAAARSVIEETEK